MSYIIIFKDHCVFVLMFVLQIKVIKDLPVGKNFQDHVGGIFAVVRTNETMDLGQITPLTFLEYKLFGKGIVMDIFTIIINFQVRLTVVF